MSRPPERLIAASDICCSVAFLVSPEAISTSTSRSSAAGAAEAFSSEILLLLHRSSGSDFLLAPHADVNLCVKT